MQVKKSFVCVSVFLCICVFVCSCLPYPLLLIHIYIYIYILCQQVARKRRLKECSRADKWMVMLDKFGDWRKGPKSHKLRTRVRKGVPDCVRGEVWQRLTGSKVSSQDMAVFCSTK